MSQQPSFLRERRCLALLLLVSSLSFAVHNLGATDFGDRTISQYEPYLEWSVTNSTWSGSAFDVVATVTFAHTTNGARHVTEMFYDGSDTWKFRFTGALQGIWTFTTSSLDSDLDGHTGRVLVTAPAPGAEGFTIQLTGDKWGKQGTNRAIVPNYVMISEDMTDWDEPSEREALLVEFMDDTGFTGVHPAVTGAQFFDLDSSEAFDNSMNTADLEPDPRTFQVIEEMILACHARGGMMHLWLWGDSSRNQNLNSVPATGGINGVVDQRLQRYLAARLGPLPGWSAGYGYDLFEWVNGSQLTEWRNYMHSKLGWFHYLGARGNKNEIVDSQISEDMDYNAYEQHHYLYDFDDWVTTMNDRPGKPNFSEDRFRIRNSGRAKDFTNADGAEGTRRLMWALTMAGGIAAIWGDLEPDWGKYGSSPYAQKETLKTFDTFWNTNRRFLETLEVGGQGGDDSTRVLVTPNRGHWIVYKQNTDNITVNLEGFSGAKPVVAIDAAAAYAEVALSPANTGSQTFSLPSTSDWAIAIGDFTQPETTTPPGGTLAGDRFRLIVSTDIGGSDADDFQSMVHLLVYADGFDLEGLISSPPHGGRKQDILDAIDAYETDYPNLLTYSPLYPSPDYLRSISFQGAIDPQSGTNPPGSISAGAQHIIDRAKVPDGRPLYIAVWGSLTDVAQAVAKDPSIKSKIRVYSIGSWNTYAGDPNARNWLYDNRSGLWWIENDTTFRGMYQGGDQSSDLGNTSFVSNHVDNHGALGDFFYSKKTDIKMGDTPSILYFLRGDPDDPESDHWGGRFIRPDAAETFWTDDPDPAWKEGDKEGAKTVNQWREDYLRDWQTRMDRAQAPKDDGSVNQKPAADAGDDQTVNDTAGDGTEQVTLDGSGSSDPDNDPLTYQWSWVGGTAGGMNPTVTLNTADSPVTLLLTVTDPGGLSDTDEVVITLTSPPPNAPGNLVAQPASPSRISLFWEDKSSDETGFIVQRSDGSGGGDLAVSLVSYAGANTTPRIEAAGTDDAFVVGAPQANDRGNLWTSVPTLLDGAARLFCARSDRRTDPVGSIYTVNFSAPGTVFLVADGRYGGAKLSWMGEEWTDSGMTATTDEATTNPWTIWQQNIAAAGNVTLGVDTENYSGVNYVFLGNAWQQVAVLAADAEDWPDNPLPAETEFSYRVAAERSGVLSTWSNQSTAATPGLTQAFAAWQERHFSPAQLADPAVSGALATATGDGVVNKLKFALGYGAFETISAVELGSPKVFRFQRNLEDPLFSLDIWTSQNLASWNDDPAGYSIQSLSVNPATSTSPLTQTFEIRPPAGTDPPQFYLQLRAN